MRAAITVCALALYFAPTASATLPSKFFGLQFAFPESPKNMKIVGKSGADYFRVNFSPSMSHSQIEGIFDLAFRNGVTILPDVYGGKEPVANACALTEPVNPWRALVQYLATFYGPGGGFWKKKEEEKAPWPAKPIEAIEIWNEPNRGLNSFDGKKPMPAETAYFVNRCAEAIHAVAPAMKVLMGGLLTVKESKWVTDEDGVERFNYTIHDFLEIAHNLEPTVKYDGVGLHPYAFKPNGVETIAERVGKNITSGRENVSAFIGAGMPIWITEVGWPSWGSDTSHETVAEPERAGVLGDTITWVENHQVSYNIQSLIYYNYRGYENGIAWDRRCGLVLQQPAGKGIDDEGKVLGAPYSKGESLFTKSWDTFKNRAGGALFYPIAPAASLNGIAFVTATSARLYGIYNANELQSEYNFEWGQTTSYGNSTPRRDAGFDGVNHDVLPVDPKEREEGKWGEVLTGLTPGDERQPARRSAKRRGQPEGADDRLLLRIRPHYVLWVHHADQGGWLRDLAGRSKRRNCRARERRHLSLPGRRDQLLRNLKRRRQNVRGAVQRTGACGEHQAGHAGR